MPNPKTKFTVQHVVNLILDKLAYAFRVILYFHAEMHSGSAYTASKVWTLPAGASSNILVVTPNTEKMAHFEFQSISDDVLTFNVYEAPDYSGANPMTAFNRNRNSSNLSGLTLDYDATDDGGGKGTLIWTFKGGANKTVTMTSGERREFILKKNTKYLFENVGALNDIVTTLLDWYEHTGR